MRQLKAETNGTSTNGSCKFGNGGSSGAGEAGHPSGIPSANGRPTASAVSSSNPTSGWIPMLKEVMEEYCPASFATGSLHDPRMSGSWTWWSECLGRDAKDVFEMLLLACPLPIPLPLPELILLSGGTSTELHLLSGGI